MPALLKHTVMKKINIELVMEYAIIFITMAGLAAIKVFVVRG